jgi:hypothetical protein
MSKLVNDAVAIGMFLSLQIAAVSNINIIVIKLPSSTPKIRTHTKVFFWRNKKHQGKKKL